MGGALNRSGRRGILQAELNWIKCGDPGGITNEFKNMVYDISTLDKQINLDKVNIDLQLADTEMEIFMNQCLENETEAMLEHEILLEKKFRPSDLVYNMKALIIDTRKHIPEDIIIGLSFGWKFLFPYITTDYNLHETLSQIEMCIDDAIPPLSHHEAYATISHILNGRGKLILDDATQWLNFLAMRTKRFFKSNKDLFATRSDKGGHTVILEVSQYEEAIDRLLDNPCYTLMHDDPLKEMVKLEENVMRIFSRNFKTHEFMEREYEPDTKELAKFYGLPKVHKKVFSLRPITAMTQAPGHASGRIFNKLLNIIFPRTQIHIKDSYEMKEFADIAIIRDEDILVSFDVVSMYTNIPRLLVKSIIMERHKDFYEQFGIGRIILEKIVDLLLVHTTVFTANGRIYIQNEGLPMGGCISTTLARMVMDLVVGNLLLHEPSCTFIKVFVDDTIAAVRRDRVENALKILNDFHPNMEFTHEIEDQRRSINFLNLTLYRDGNFITTNWYRKLFASGRLLPYYTSHKRSTIMATAEAFITTVIRLSDPFFFPLNRTTVEKTLHDNGFPETVVQVLMNNHYTLMRMKKTRRKRAVKYKIFPHALCESRRIKKVLHKLKHNDIVFAESTKNTKVNFVTTRKTRTPYENRSNLVLKSTCQCGMKTKFTLTKFNETGAKASKRIITTFKRCDSLHSFRKIEFIRGLAYNKQTKYLLKYLEMRHEGTVVDRGGLPNIRFVNVLKNKKKTFYKKKAHLSTFD